MNGTGEYGPEVTVGQLRRFTAQDRARLAATLGVAGWSDTRADAARLDTAQRDAAKVAGVIEGLGTDARVALLLAVVMGHIPCHGTSRVEAFLEREYGFAESRSRRAISELETAGLLVASPDGDSTRSVPLGFASSTASRACALLAGARPERPETCAVPFGLALLTALMIESPPRLTAEGRPYVRWMETVLPRLHHSRCPPDHALRLLAMLLRLRLGHAEEAGGVRHLHADLPATAAALAGRTDHLAAAVVRHESSDTNLHSRMVLLALELCRRDDGPAEIAWADLVRAAGRIQACDDYTIHDHRPWRAPSQANLAETVGFLRTLGMVEVAPGPELTTVRVAAPKPGDGKWTVLPTFEVLVPDDVPPDAVVRLACVARLQTTERVSTFVLDRASVSKRASVPGAPASALAILRERSVHAIPANVEATVASWETSGGSLLPFHSYGFVATGPEARALVAKHGAGAVEVAPGVFLVGQQTFRSVAHDAKKAALPVLATVQPDLLPDSGDPWDSGVPLRDEGERLASRLRQCRAVIEKAEAKAAAAAAAQKAAAEKAAQAAAASRARAPSKAPKAAGTGKKAGKAKPGPLDIVPDTGRARTPSEERDARTLAVECGYSRTGPEADLAVRWPLIFLALLGGNDILLSFTAELSEELLQYVGAGTSEADIRHRAQVATGFVPAGSAAPGTAPRGGAGRVLPGPGSKATASGASAGAKTGVGATRAATTAATQARSAPPSSSAPAPDARPWVTPPAGEVRAWMQSAADLEAEIEILYASSSGRTSERVVRILAVRSASGVDWIDVSEKALGGAKSSLRLDRVAAIRA